MAELKDAANRSEIEIDSLTEEIKVSKATVVTSETDLTVKTKELMTANQMSEDARSAHTKELEEHKATIAFRDADIASKSAELQTTAQKSQDEIAGLTKTLKEHEKTIGDQEIELGAIGEKVSASLTRQLPRKLFLSFFLLLPRVVRPATTLDVRLHIFMYWTFAARIRRDFGKGDRGEARRTCAGARESRR